MAGLKGEKSQINWILLFQTHIYIKYYLSINIVAFVVLNQSTLVTQFAIVSVTMDAAHRVNILILLKYIGYLLKECLVFFSLYIKQIDWFGSGRFRWNDTCNPGVCTPAVQVRRIAYATTE